MRILSARGSLNAKAVTTHGAMGPVPIPAVLVETEIKLVGIGHMLVDPPKQKGQLSCPRDPEIKGDHLLGP